MEPLSRMPSDSLLAIAEISTEDWVARSRPETIASLEREGRIRACEDGESVTRRGDVVDRMTIVLTGALEASITSLDGRRHVLNLVGPGQFINLIAILDDQMAIHDFEAHGSCRLFQISKARFIEIVDQDPALSRYLLRLLCLRSRILYDRLADFCLMSVRVRCLRVLLNLIPINDQNAMVRNHEIVISQSDFAEIVGSSRQTVNQELRRLQDEGLIQIGYSSICIIDTRAIIELIDGNY